ncbi:hypothetical protein BV898_05532 [Hypsibius exemplaris]|uniref:Ragulator complex protein LAMTOR1 n=1 Tax=Hypsibius exemplaris TaxID=2072580 RepID=A0A1W0WZ57_HYPEX|nr:hypothetical protein BV898_05532 [Hypsibius exemplaris]
MGNICKSCCGGDDSQNDSDGQSEQTRLLNGATRAQAIEPQGGEYSTRTNSVLKKNDEQSALNRILHKAASNVIDVAALDAHGMEQHEFSEKAKTYSQKLQTATVHLKNRSKKREPLPESNMPVERLAALPVISAADLELIRNLSANMESAYQSFAVQHGEELIVNFAMS